MTICLYIISIFVVYNQYQILIIIKKNMPGLRSNPTPQDMLITFQQN